MGSNEKNINGDGMHAPAEDVLAGLDFSKKPTVSLLSVTFYPAKISTAYYSRCEDQTRTCSVFCLVLYVTHDTDRSSPVPALRPREVRVRRDQHLYYSPHQPTRRFCQSSPANGIDSDNETLNLKRWVGYTYVTFCLDNSLFIACFTHNVIFDAPS
jgi:hypothetical protein